MKGRFAVSVVLALALLAVAVFAEGAGARGVLKLEGANVDIQITGADKAVRTITAKNSEASLEAGTYKPWALRLVKRDQTGKAGKPATTWVVTSRGPWGAIAKIDVAQGKTTTLKAGEPLTMKANVSYGGGTALVGFEIVGSGGEVYQPYIYKNGQAQSPPGLKIVDESGKELASGKFQYG